MEVDEELDYQDYGTALSWDARKHPKYIWPGVKGKKGTRWHRIRRVTVHYQRWYGDDPHIHFVPRAFCGATFKWDWAVFRNSDPKACEPVCGRCRP